MLVIKALPISDFRLLNPVGASGTNWSPPSLPAGVPDNRIKQFENRELATIMTDFKLHIRSGHLLRLFKNIVAAMH